MIVERSARVRVQTMQELVSVPELVRDSDRVGLSVRVTMDARVLSVRLLDDIEALGSEIARTRPDLYVPAQHLDRAIVTIQTRVHRVWPLAPRLHDSQRDLDLLAVDDRRARGVKREASVRELADRFRTELRLDLEVPDKTRVAPLGDAVVEDAVPAHWATA